MNTLWINYLFIGIFTRFLITNKLVDIINLGLEMKIGVVIPCYRVKNKIVDVIARIPVNIIEKIYVVDDCCPEQSGIFVQNNCQDDRVKIIFNPINLGVGGAVKRGYEQAIIDKIDIIVKIDGDGQMDPELIPYFISPLTRCRADYTKGNRFFKIQYLKSMPKLRLFGNTMLSFITKLSTGHWRIMDPTNGYTAVRVNLFQYIDLIKVDNRYFFETDMLFQLGLIKARVIDIPMQAIYADEKSGLSIKKIMFEFLYKHMKSFFKRICINYFLRDFNVGSVLLLIGFFSSLIVLFMGVPLWLRNEHLNQFTPVGTIIFYLIWAMSGIGGFLGFLLYDVFAQSHHSIMDLINLSDEFNT